MYSFFGIWIQVFYYSLCTVVLGIITAIIKASAKQKIILAVIMLATVVLICVQLDAVIHPNISTVEGVFVEYKKNGIRGYIGSLQYHFVDDNNCDFYLDADSFTIKHLYDKPLQKGIKYAVSYEKKSNIIVAIEKCTE